MTFEKLSQAEELRDRRDTLCEKLQDLMLMRKKVDDCVETGHVNRGEVWVTVGSGSNMYGMYIDVDAIKLMLAEADARYSEKKREAEDEFAKL